MSQQLAKAPAGVVVDQFDRELATFRAQFEQAADHPTMVCMDAHLNAFVGYLREKGCKLSGPFAITSSAQRQIEQHFAHLLQPRTP